MARRPSGSQAETAAHATTPDHGGHDAAPGPRRRAPDEAPRRRRRAMARWSGAEREGGGVGQAEGGEQGRPGGRPGPPRAWPPTPGRPRPARRWRACGCRPARTRPGPAAGRRRRPAARAPKAATPAAMSARPSPSVGGAEGDHLHRRAPPAPTSAAVTGSSHTAMAPSAPAQRVGHGLVVAPGRLAGQPGQDGRVDGLGQDGVGREEDEEGHLVGDHPALDLAADDDGGQRAAGPPRCAGGRPTRTGARARRTLGVAAGQPGPEPEARAPAGRRPGWPRRRPRPASRRGQQQPLADDRSRPGSGPATTRKTSRQATITTVLPMGAAAGHGEHPPGVQHGDGHRAHGVQHELRHEEPQQEGGQLLRLRRPRRVVRRRWSGARPARGASEDADHARRRPSTSRAQPEHPAGQPLGLAWSPRSSSSTNVGHEHGRQRAGGQQLEEHRREGVGRLEGVAQVRSCRARRR